MNAIIATRLWLGGAPLADLQQLVGDQVALEDGIRDEILRAAREDGKRLTHEAVLTEGKTLGNVKAPKNGNRRPVPRQAPPPPRPAPKAMGRTLDLTGYPAQLQDPRSTLRRRVWDALAEGPREMRALADELAEHIPGDDAIRQISGTLWAMTSVGLLVKDDSTRPATWRRS